MRIWVGQLAVVMVLVLAANQLGCHGSGSADAEIANQLRVGIEETPQTLDPRHATGVAGQRIGQLVFSRLVRLGYDLQIVPELATSWETPDAITYVFHLRDDVRFHDGEPLTAEDVAFTFRHLMAAETQSYYSTVYTPKIAAIEVIDPYTVRFALHQPTASFLNDIIYPILPQHVLAQADDDFAEHPIGSGPFRLVSRSQSRITLAAHALYHNGPPPVEQVVVEIIQDESTRLFKMMRGELDLLVNAMPMQKLGRFNEAPLSELYRLVEEPGISYNYLAFNLANSQVRSVELRRAIAHGIDVEELLEHQMEGHAVRARGLLSPVNWYCEPDVATYDHDPGRARQLLDAAGFPDPDGDGPEPRLRLELKCTNSAEAVDKARLIQGQLARIGIDLQLRTLEWQTFFPDIKAGNFQLTLMRWVGVTEPDFYYSLFHSSEVPPIGRNRGRYTNPDIDRLVAEGRVTLEPEQRRLLYSQVQKQLALDLPYISLWHANNISIVHRRVRGYRQHPLAAWYVFDQIHLDGADGLEGSGQEH
jgi:peptide/nickel transport system substrate-binding protein